LKKPVELVYLPEGNHQLVRPWERLVSQQGCVDWLDFWLQSKESTNPAQPDEYLRWRGLRKLQEAQDAERARSEQETTVR
jgi:hypothetical protein